MHHTIDTNQRPCVFGHGCTIPGTESAWGGCKAHMCFVSDLARRLGFGRTYKLGSLAPDDLERMIAMVSADPGAVACSDPDVYGTATRLHVIKRTLEFENCWNHRLEATMYREIAGFEHERNERLATVIRRPFNQHFRAEHYGLRQGVCEGCGLWLRECDMSADHVVPLCDGGPDVYSNIALLCMPCNSRKGTGTMRDLLESRTESGEHYWLDTVPAAVRYDRWRAYRREHCLGDDRTRAAGDRSAAPFAA